VDPLVQGFELFLKEKKCTLVLKIRGFRRFLLLSKSLLSLKPMTTRIFAIKMYIISHFPQNLIFTKPLSYLIWKIYLTLVKPLASYF